MDKNINFDREELTKKVMDELKKFFDAAKNAKTLHYRSLIGTEYEEEPGAYNDYMVRAMARDMMTFWLYVKAKDPEIGKIVESWMPKMTTHNTELMRMWDDFKGERPLKGKTFFNSRKGVKFITAISKVAKSDVIKDVPIEDIKEKLIIWADRIVYQMSWAYYMEQKRYAKEQLMEAETKEIDADGNILHGLSEDDEAVVKSLCAMRNVLLKVFLKIPAGNPLHQELLDKIEWIHLIIQAVLEEKIDKLIGLIEKEEVL